MIIFDLLCECGFQFEGWFQSRDDYEEQLTRGVLQCPMCAGHQVHKILSPIAGTKKSGPALPVGSGGTDYHAVTGEVEGVGKIISELQRFVEKHFEDVGPRLAEESLKMHYGVVEKRNIRGVASEEQEKVLKDEGIELLKIPMSVKKESKKLD